MPACVRARSCVCVCVCVCAVCVILARDGRDARKDPAPFQEKACFCRGEATLAGRGSKNESSVGAFPVASHVSRAPVEVAGKANQFLHGKGPIVDWVGGRGEGDKETAQVAKGGENEWLAGPKIRVLRPNSQFMYQADGDEWQRMLIFGIDGMASLGEADLELCSFELFLTWLPAGKMHILRPIIQQLTT